MVVSQSVARIAAVLHDLAPSSRSRQGANVTENRYIYQVYRPTARVLSTVLMPSIRVVVVGIENRAGNDATGTLRVQNTLVSHFYVICNDLT